MNTDDLKYLRIAIVGAGYAGAAAAKALSNLGASVTVYEQASQIHEVGAGIGLRPSSMDQFNSWGIGPAIKAVTSPSDAFEILTGLKPGDDEVAVANSFVLKAELGKAEADHDH